MIKRLVRFLPVLSILGLSGCLSSVVKDLLISSVKITPANPTIAIGAMQQFSLVVTYVDGQTDHPSPSSTAWSSDNAAVATINKMGVATGVAVGTANIGGSYHGNNTTTVLTVTEPANVAIAVHGDSRVLYVTNLRTGQQMTFAANGLGDSVMVSLDSDSRTAAQISVLPERGPAWLAVDPSGRYLYVLNQSSESVSAFAIDWKTGALEAVVSSPFPVSAKPSSVEVDSDGAGLAVAHLPGGDVSHFLIDPATGALTRDTQ
ncbi:MAG: beta-propeller fold lactonase family protein [Candidatus Acidiferrales bacterium]